MPWCKETEWLWWVTPGRWCPGGCMDLAAVGLDGPGCGIEHDDQLNILAEDALQ